MVDIEGLEIDQLVKELNISRDTAITLVAAHEDFVEKLSELGNTPFALSLIITTAISIAAVEGMPPRKFIQLVVDVMEVCSLDKPQSTFIADA